MAGMFEGSIKCLEQEQRMVGDCKVNVEGAVEGDKLLAVSLHGGDMFARDVEGGVISVRQQWFARELQGLHGGRG